MPLLTVGHGPEDRVRLGARLTGAGVDAIVDVRRFPGSRVNADVRREAMAAWLPAAGIGYRWEERLGGRRRLPAGEPVADAWWTVAQFAAYAAHTRTAEFTRALEEVLAEAATATVALMCSESVWWRCHRRLIADVLVSLGERVLHVRGEEAPEAHRLTPPARIVAGVLTYAGDPAA